MNTTLCSTNQAIGKVVEWATGRTFKRGEAGRVTEVNSSEAVAGR
jgi:hypothetical protein